MISGPGGREDAKKHAVANDMRAERSGRSRARKGTKIADRPDHRVDRSALFVKRSKDWQSARELFVACSEFRYGHAAIDQDDLSGGVGQIAAGKHGDGAADVFGESPARL